VEDESRRVLQSRALGGKRKLSAGMSMRRYNLLGGGWMRTDCSSTTVTSTAVVQHVPPFLIHFTIDEEQECISEPCVKQVRSLFI
jgi:hypothetical protein